MNNNNYSDKIYTKTGDKGETSLLGGMRVPKYHHRIEAYGSTDELNSFIGLLRASNIDENSRTSLLIVQNNLFTIEAMLAAPNKNDISSIKKVDNQDVIFLEQEIDRMQKELPELKSFILPGGSVAVSYAHVARSICRRVERIVIKLSEEVTVDEVIISYFNRLSDYLFVLSRYIAKQQGSAEILWEPL